MVQESLGTVLDIVHQMVHAHTCNLNNLKHVLGPWNWGLQLNWPVIFVLNKF